jgi:MFS transporter, DHA1 family, tetracycline resistance protein
LFPHPGRLLSTYGFRLPCFAAAGFRLLNWVYGFFVLPESLLADRRSAIDFAKANPFTTLKALTKVQGIAAWCGSLFLPPSLNSILQSTWILYTTFRFGVGTT